MKTRWLVCLKCAGKQPFSLIGKCTCGGTLLVEYDMDEVKYTFNRGALRDRETTMWRYFELLPVEAQRSVVSLGEGWTPLVRLSALEAKLPVQSLYVKREEQNPTGSFKARGFSVAVSLLAEDGADKAAVPSNGNAASALAAYAARAGMSAFVFMPKDCPPAIVEECIHYGASVCLVDGYIHDAGKIVEDGKIEQGWRNVGTLKEPGRVEGKKTMGLELAEQFGWKLPDVIVYPTGGGSGVVGLWKAFNELKALGMVEGDLPRIISVQEEGCQPIVDAMASGGPVAETEGTVSAAPTGLRVPSPPDGELIVRILRQTGGTAVAVSRREIEEAQRLFGCHGISSSPEGAATLAGLQRLCDSGTVRRSDRVVLFNTSHAMKYISGPIDSRVPFARNYGEWIKQTGAEGRVR